MGIDMHASIIERFKDGLLSWGEVHSADVLEVGSADVNGTIRPFVERHEPNFYIGVDAASGKGVDRVLDCELLADEFGANRFDIVISTEMLEHVRDWRLCLVSMAEVVRLGGLLVLTTRSPGFPFHPFPEDHWRFSVYTMERIIYALGFQSMVCEPDPDPKSPGVIVKARKPPKWRQPEGDLYDIKAEPAVEETGMEKFTVTKQHGRVFRQVSPRRRVLVAIPGDEISIELARECGLVKEEPKAKEPAKKAAEKKTAAPAKEAAPKVTSFPTKASKG